MPEPHPSPWRSALVRVTSPPLATGVAAALALGTLAIQAVYLATRADPATVAGEPGTGDFLAFFTGARLIAGGHGAALYDFDAQRTAQAAVLGNAPVDWFQGYLNPPLLAAALAPVTRLGYVPSFLLFDAVCLLVAAAGAIAIAPHLRALLPRPIDRGTAACLVYASPGLARVWVGGQNTPITLGLLAVVYAAAAAGRPWLAGAAVGLLSYKPQYALLLGLWFAWRRDARVVAAAAVVGLAHHALGAAIVGVDWPLRMAAAMRVYTPMELAANAATHFSWIRATAFSLPPGIAGPIGAVGALAAIGVAAWVGRAPPEDPRFGAAFATAVTAAMLASPHLQYYDVGVLALPVVLLAEHAARRGPVTLAARLALVAAWGAYPAWTLGARLGVQPLAGLLVATFVVAALAARPSAAARGT